MSDQLDQQTKARAWDLLVSHLQDRTDVQNIQLMEIAGFCRNCMSKWLVKAADEHGQSLEIDAAKSSVYGMPYQLWKEKYQK